MFKQSVQSASQSEGTTQGVSSGPVCWYPGPETWNDGTGLLDGSEHDIALNGAGFAPSEDFLFA